jgi:hypothetical protein
MDVQASTMRRPGAFSEALLVTIANFTPVPPPLLLTPLVEIGEHWYSGRKYNRSGLWLFSNSLDEISDLQHLEARFVVPPGIYIKLWSPTKLIQNVLIPTNSALR